MKHLTIRLPEELYRELLAAAAKTHTPGEHGEPPKPEQFAAECVESVLASRRLDRMYA